ncbi:MAG: hypothetical protein ABUK08_00115 [Candidatus Humimicrobiaceae bacterium]
MLATLISGGLIGTIGSFATNIVGYFKKKQEHKQAIELKKLDIEFNLASLKMETETRRGESADDLIESSYKHDSSFASGQIKEFSMIERILLVGMDLFRGSIRPLLTLFLIWQVHVTRVEVNAILNAAGVEGLSVADSLGIYKEVVRMILFLASTAVCWWFGSRPPRGEEVPKK